MRFQPEPAYHHGQPPRTAVLLVNLGTPDEATAPALRRYLREFLSDPRIVEIPRAIWWSILHGVILRTRPARSAAKYASVWMPEGSPLAVWTQRQAAALGQSLAAAGHQVTVRVAMRYGNPSLPSTLDALLAHCSTLSTTLALVAAAYCGYSGSTSTRVTPSVRNASSVLGSDGLP